MKTVVFLKKWGVLVVAPVLFAACFTQKPIGHFDPKMEPPAPDYSKAACWAALPDRDDAPDRVPVFEGVKDGQSTAAADVFFLHPTTYTGSKRREKHWNGAIFDPKLQKKTNSTLALQASVFNGAGRVFAPYYRQAHLTTFFTKKRLPDAEKALALAHADVEAAFDYYLKNWNQGRPIILAGHSQGSYHAMLLLKKHFDGTPLANRLVAAYIPGWPVPKDFFQKLKPCDQPDETGCICSWRTYRRGFEGVKWMRGPNIVVTNPLSWTTETGRFVDKKANKGAVLLKFKVYPQLCDAEIHDGFLWTTKPHFPGSFLIRTPNYHPGDFNLFYLSVRENVGLRVQKFLKK